MFHTAAQWTAAAITVQCAVRKRLEMLAAAATVIETAAWRRLTKRQLWLGFGTAITIESAARILLAKAKFRCLCAAEEQRRTVAAVAIQRVD